MTNRLFLAGLTMDASVVQRDASTSIQSGYQATVDVSCGDGLGGDGLGTDISSGNLGAVFDSMTVTTRGYGYDAGKILTVSKNNASITHIIDISDARMLNLGVLTVDKAEITSAPIYNDGANGEVNGSPDGTGAIVTVQTKDTSGTDVSFIEMQSSGSGYVVDDVVRITNPANTLQTIDLSLTQFDANLLNGLTILDLTYGEPTIDTRSFRTHDSGVPSKVLGKTDRGNVIELEVANNGTWVKSVTVRDGATSGAPWTTTDTIEFINLYNSDETFELSGSILDASFINALNNGEEYVLTDTANNVNSITDSSNALTNALTGGIYFEDATTFDVTTISGTGDGSGAQITVTCTDGKNMPVVELNVGADRSQITGTFDVSDVLLFRNNYQTITKQLTEEDAKLLNNIKEIAGNNYPGVVGNDTNNRKITSVQIFTDGAFGSATSTSGSDAIIRVDTNDISDSVISVLTVRKAGSLYADLEDVIITNLQDDRQTIKLTISADATDNTLIDINELNDEADKVLNIAADDVNYLFYGGTSFNVQAVKNGVNNKKSEAVVTIICDGNQSESYADRGAHLQAISLTSAAQPGTDNTNELYYAKGNSVTFTVDEAGEHLNEDDAINQDTEHYNAGYTVKYKITIDSLTQEQADVLNGNMVGTNVPLLPGDVLVLMSTISSPQGVDGQEQFEQSFLTQYQLAE
jgi:hypothetical protein